MRGDVKSRTANNRSGTEGERAAEYRGNKVAELLEYVYRVVISARPSRRAGDATQAGNLLFK